MNTFNLVLDLDKRYDNEPVRIRQGDKLGTTIHAAIFDHGQPLTTTNMTPYLLVELPDREHYYRKQGTFSGNVATIEVNEEQAASVAGITDNAYIEIRQGSSVIASTGAFTVRILRDAISGRTVPDSYDDKIEQAIDAIPDMVTHELEERGAAVVLTVTDGDLSITLNVPESEEQE